MRLYEHLTEDRDGEQSTAALCEFCHKAIDKGCELYLGYGEKILGFESIIYNVSCAFCGEGPMRPDYIIFSSFGNDSIALIQTLNKDTSIPNESIMVCYSQTHWGSPEWDMRAKKAFEWVKSLNMQGHIIDSEGFEALARRKQAFPRNGMQFCTEELKIKPAAVFLDSIDPDKEIVCCVGVRREESRSRAQWPVWTEESDQNGGRSLWSPLALVKEAERDELIYEAGWTPTPNRSQECYPCVNANKSDIRLLTPERIAELKAIEDSMGYTSKGKKRTLFRPYRHMGAVGVEEVYKWSQSSHGKYEPPTSGCDSGFCGT